MHASILTGGSYEALQAYAVERAAAAVCRSSRNGEPCRTCRDCRKAFAEIHPDIICIRREKNKDGKLRRELVVDQIRALSKDSPVLPNEAARKVYILEEADKMNEEAQNAFLKLLEEPPSFVVFLLCAENASLLLPTVRSRCAAVQLGGEEARCSDTAREKAEAYLSSLGDPVKLLKWYALCEKTDIAELRETVDALRMMAPERMRDPKELLSLEKELETAAAYLRQNVNVKHVLGMLSTYEMRNDL